MLSFLFFFNDTATTEIYTLSLHDALPISAISNLDLHRTSYATFVKLCLRINPSVLKSLRSEEHTSELQSHHDLVCRLLLEKKKKIKQNIRSDTTTDTIKTLKTNSKTKTNE